jgi:hypothetical protein
MIFGEPDIAMTRNAENKVVVEVKGVDVYASDRSRLSHS